MKDKFVRMIYLVSIAISLALWTGTALPEESACERLIELSEINWINNNYDESDCLLTKSLNTCPDRFDVYWRMIRNEYDRIESIPRSKKPDKEALVKRYQAMEDMADLCIEKDKNDGNCYLWKGIAMGRRGLTQCPLFWGRFSLMSFSVCSAGIPMISFLFSA